MPFVTMIKSSKPVTLGKLFTLDKNGDVTKNAIANVSEGQATALGSMSSKELLKLISLACERDDIALMSGRFIGAEHNSVQHLITEKKLGQILECESKDVPGGVQIIDGKSYVARLKRGIEPSSWILIDADNPEGIPLEWASKNIQQRLELLEQVIPGISTCLRVEYRSSSARVVKVGEAPGTATHAWIQITDPEKLEVMREYLKVQMQINNLSFKSPRHDRETGLVIGNEARTLIDLAVWVPGRLIFCSKPVVQADGYYIADAGVRVVNPDGGLLDISKIKLPSQESLEQLQYKTGTTVSFTKSGNKLNIIDHGSLKWETPIEVKGRTCTLSEIIYTAKMGDKIRCEAPFRASKSEAAFIRVLETGMPCLHDVGTSTTYFLDISDELKWNRSIAEADIPDVLAAVNAAPIFNNFHPVQPQTVNNPTRLYADLVSDQTIILRAGKQLRSNLANIAAIFEHSVEWDKMFSYNEFTDEYMLMRPVLGTRTPRSSFKPRQLKDNDFTHVVIWLQRNGFPQVTKEIVSTAIFAVAEQRIISPVRHYLENIEKQIDWSPKTHSAQLRFLCEKYFGVTVDETLAGSHPDYLQAVSEKFMISAVARAFQPGCKVDTMLVLDGPQGAGKSTAAAILAGQDWFSDSLPAVGTKDASDHIRGKWFIEIGELASLSKTETETTKAFISRQVERYRRPYDRSETTYLRRCVFVGTTNQDTYLKDETGNRRFWPVRVGAIDQEALKRDRDLLWAEAVFLYRQGKPWHMTSGAAVLAETAQLSRVSEDIWQAILEQSLEAVNEVSLKEAADKILLEQSKVSKADQNRLSACLKAIGFVPRGRFTAGSQRSAVRYVRSNTVVK